MKSTSLHSISYQWTVLAVTIVTLLLATIDTHAFVYPALSRSLLPELLILILSVIALGNSIVKRHQYVCTWFDCFILVWIAYIVFHFTLCTPHEEYRTLYLSVTLFGIPTFSYFIQHGIVTGQQCGNMLLVIAVIHLIYIMGQGIGILDSGNGYFRLTGSNENPTVTALYLVGCVPVIVARISMEKRLVLYSMFLVGCIIAIIILRCRTAYIGLAVESVVGLASFIRKRPIHIHTIAKALCVFFVALFSIIAGIRLYNMKRDSADGRLLIWKLSAEMIAERPQGYGYGLFEKEYNLRQSEYFRNNKGATVTERRNGGFVAMAYNDYLEHGVQGGVVGMFFLAAFYILILRQSVKQGKITEASIIAAFAVMSTTNFVSTAIQPWLLIIFSCANVSATKDRTCNKCSLYTAFWVLPVVLAGIHEISSVTLAQERLKERGAVVGISAPIGTSEAYWTRRAERQMQSKEYSEALRSIHAARLYTSSISLFTMEYQCRSAMGQETRGIAFIDTLSYMNPSRLSSKYMLMRYYDKKGLSLYALTYAYDILQTETKLPNAKSAFIINEARKYAERYEK